MAESVGELLRDLRAARSLSLAKLALRAGVAARTLIYWEAGTYQPRLPELEAALTALSATEAQRAQAVALLEAPRGMRQVRLATAQSRHENELGPLPSGGDLLRCMRLRRGLYLEQVALEMGVSAPTVSRWEQGRIVPPPERLQTLLTLLGAGETERIALLKGYVFLTAPLRETMPSSEALRAGFETFTTGLYANREDKMNDLRFLSYEAQAWRFAAQGEDGKHLLAAVCAQYAAYLAGFERFTEAGRYAYRALDLQPKSATPDESVLRAAIIAARADVYRGVRPLPRRGLEMLRLWRSSMHRPDFQAWLLADMAEYLSLEEDWESALRLRREACQVAEACRNPNELRLRRLDLAKVEVRVGNAEQAMSLVNLSALDTPFRRADIELLFAEGLVAMKERKGAQVWFERARMDMQTYDLVHLRNRAAALEPRL